MAAIVTKETLKQMLKNPNPRYVDMVLGRALVVLFNNQTETEKQANETKVYNEVGFTGADARSGTITAKYFLKHGKLSDWQREAWLRPDKHGTPRIVKYHKQLNAAAAKRQATQLPLGR